MIYTNFRIRLLFGFIVLFTAGFSLITNEQITVGDAEEHAVKPRFDPSPDPKRNFLGFLTSSGYTQQPKENYYITSGDELNIKTNVDRPTFSYPILLAHYYWLQSTDGKTWSKVPEAIDGKSSLDFQIEKPGRLYYQLETSYIIFSPNLALHTQRSFYSKVATVNIMPKPVDAKGIKININDNYLYNIKSDILRNSTFVHSTSDPFNATESPKWTSDRPDLIKFDKDGTISLNSLNAPGISNTASNSGIVKITGTISNKNNPSSVSDSKEITIGNGLLDQSIPEGKKAHFEIQGLNDDKREDPIGNIVIKWYEQSGSQSKKLVKTQTNPTDKVFYEIPHVNNTQDNGKKYYAEIIVKQGKDSSNVLLGPATLKVLPPNNPKMIVSTILTNKTFSKNNTDTQLNEVVNNDELNYDIDLQNESKRDIHNSYITLPLHLDTQIENIKIDGIEIANSDYSLTTNEKNQLLNIKLGDFDNSHKEKKVFISTTVKNINKRESFDSRVDFFGLDPDSDEYTSQGKDLNINYINNKLNFSLKSLNFEPITIFDQNTLKHRLPEENDPNEMISIDDQRRDRKHIALYLTQNTSFINGTTELPVDLRYYEGDSFKSLYNTVLVHETTPGEIFKSIKWHKNQGPLLHVNKGNLMEGKYSAALTWQFSDSIHNQ